MRFLPWLTIVAGCLLVESPDGPPVEENQLDDSDAGDSDTDSGGDSDGDTDPPDSEVCARWNADRADMAEGTWSGNANTCTPGDISSVGRDNALKLLNLHRWLAGLPEVTTDATLDAAAQQCALMMDANASLNHDPPNSWDCYTADGATAAGNSNLASGPGVMAVDMYMQDWGNEQTLGHRRWILSDSLGPVGIGSTDNFSCMWVIGGEGTGSSPWTAWPPPGAFPHQAVTMSFTPLDETGWSIQSDTINFADASVTVTTGDEVLPVDVEVLAAWYGSHYAIAIVPDGWTSEAGATYHVSVTGVSQAIDYDVEMVDCD